MDSRLPIAVVGLNFGRIIIKQLTEGPAAGLMRLAAVCDQDRARADAVGQKTGCKAYYGLDDVLQDDEIPTISLITGPVGRAALIERCLRAGKDVMTTKPFERHPEEARRVLELAKKLGRVVHLNSPSTLPPPNLAQIQQWREKFQLGRPVSCRADVWVSYREQENGTWYDDPRLCPVAPIFRLGIYLINDLVRLFGSAESVQVFHSRLFTSRPTPDNAQIGIKFQNGALANIFASFCVEDGDQYRNSLTLNFQNGTIYRNVGPQRGDGESELSLIINREGRRTVAATAVSLGSHGDYQWESFARAVRGEKLPGAVTPEEIVAGVEIIDAMARADTSGNAIEIKDIYG